MKRIAITGVLGIVVSTVIFISFQNFAPHHYFGGPGCDPGVVNNLLYRQAQDGNQRVFELNFGKLPIKNNVGGPFLLLNTSNEYRQVNSVTPMESHLSGVTGEYSAHLDRMSQIVYYDGTKHPFQDWMGVNEVNSIAKKRSEAQFPTMTWIRPVNIQNGLLVPPRSCFMLGGYMRNDRGEVAQIRGYRVEVAKATRGIISVRQPQIDIVNLCNGERQQTPGQPWRNDTGRTIYLNAASVYAVQGYEGTSVQTACLAVLGVNKKGVKFNACSPQIPLNVRGRVALPGVRVLPGEWILSTAVHRCRPEEKGQAWGWALFIDAHF